MRGCTFTVPDPGRKRGRQQRGKGSTSRGRTDNGPRLVDKNALSARGGGPPRQSRSPSPDSPPAKRASSADSSGYDTDLPDEVQEEAVRKVCGALGMREQFEAAMAARSLQFRKGSRILQQSSLAQARFTQQAKRKEFKQNNCLSQQTGSTQVRTGAC